jgi:hypothetical protein
MRRSLAPTLLILALTALPGAAAAECFIHYKAKRDNPLRLHYGIVQVSGSCPGDPAGAVGSRITAAGWSLLNVTKVTQSPPSDTERASAGSHFYR